MKTFYFSHMHVYTSEQKRREGNFISFLRARMHGCVSQSHRNADEEGPGTTRRTRTPPAPYALCNEDWARPEVPVTPAASGHFSDAENASGHGAGGGIGRTDRRMGIASARKEVSVSVSVKWCTRQREVTTSAMKNSEEYRLRCECCYCCRRE